LGNLHPRCQDKFTKFGVKLGRGAGNDRGGGLFPGHGFIKEMAWAVSIPQLP
jgi:hypothetical protein